MNTRKRRLRRQESLTRILQNCKDGEGFLVSRQVSDMWDHIEIVENGALPEWTRMNSLKKVSSYSFDDARAFISQVAKRWGWRYTRGLKRKARSYGSSEEAQAAMRAATDPDAYKEYGG